MQGMRSMWSRTDVTCHSPVALSWHPMATLWQPLVLWPDADSHPFYLHASTIFHSFVARVDLEND